MSDDPLQVRPAVAADLPAVLALYAQPEMDDGAVLPIADAQGLLARFAAYPDYTLYVAEQDGRIVGTFALLVMDNLAHRGAPSAIVEDVVVAPDRHRKGIGGAMMRFAIATAKVKGCYKMMLSANARRERAHAFYQQLGLARHGYSYRIDLDGAVR